MLLKFRRRSLLIIFAQIIGEAAIVHGSHRQIKKTVRSFTKIPSVGAIDTNAILIMIIIIFTLLDCCFGLYKLINFFLKLFFIDGEIVCLDYGRFLIAQIAKRFNSFVIFIVLGRLSHLLSCYRVGRQNFFRWRCHESLKSI